MVRVPDWPARLSALLNAVEDRPFDAHRWNCGVFALAAVEACTGERPRFRPSTEVEAAADSAGFTRIAPAFARTGDVALGGPPENPRLGVVVDCGRVTFVGPRGLVREPITACTAAWRIG
jgi:hypothetical protein